nr:collagen alpha-2(VIII) chain-like [Chlorocebus sabaeus]
MAARRPLRPPADPWGPAAPPGVRVRCERRPRGGAGGRAWRGGARAEAGPGEPPRIPRGDRVWGRGLPGWRGSGRGLEWLARPQGRGLRGGASPGAGAAGDPRAVVISEPACGPWRVRGVVAPGRGVGRLPRPPAARSLGNRGRNGRGPQVPGDVIQPPRLQGAKGPLIWQSPDPPGERGGTKAGRAARRRLQEGLPCQDSGVGQMVRIRWFSLRPGGCLPLMALIV